MSDVTPESEDAAVEAAETTPVGNPAARPRTVTIMHKRVREHVAAPHFVRNAILTVLVLIAGGFLGILLEHGIRAPDGATRLTQYQDWRVVCPPMTDKGVGCNLSNSIARDAGGGTLAMLSIGSTGPEAKLNIIVPHGVLLDPGLMFVIADTPPVTRPYETCDANGCVVLVNLDAAMVTALRTKSQGQVQVATMAQTQPVTIPFSLAGFDEGYADLKREDGHRNSILSVLYR